MQRDEPKTLTKLTQEQVEVLIEDDKAHYIPGGFEESRMILTNTKSVYYKGENHKCFEYIGRMNDSQ